MHERQLSGGGGWKKERMSEHEKIDGHVEQI